MLPIHHTFAPHVDGAFLRASLILLGMPWLWNKDAAVRMLEKKLEEQMGGTCVSFASGREGLLALFKAMKLAPGDEVIIQGYTCIAVTNAVIATGATPVYADINQSTLNLTPETVTAVITPRTRAIVCQHTFGIPADTKGLRALCDAHGIALIEDCAHVLPDETGPKDIATEGDAVLLSFGRDKAISGITGGAVIVRKKEWHDAVREEQMNAQRLPSIHVASLLLYPLAYAIAKPIYTISGKLLLAVLAKLRILPKILTQEEKEGHPSQTLHALPGPCAALALLSLGKLKNINDHRRALTALYLEEARKRSWPLLGGISADLPLQKFPLFVQNAKGIRTALKQRNIHLDDGWTGCVVCPTGSSLENSCYIPGSDPKAEEAAEMILSLPTHPTMTTVQAHYLVKILNETIGNR